MLQTALPDKSEMGYTLNSQKMLVNFNNGSMLKIAGSDKPDSLRGIDAIGVVCDEWALCKQSTWTEIFMPIIAGKLRPEHASLTRRWAGFCYTPKGENHATEMFNKACCLASGGTLPSTGKGTKLKSGWFASRLDAEVSGIIPPKSLLEARANMSKEYYDQEFKCARLTEEARSIISSAALDKLRNFEHTGNQERRIVSCDPATGGDECVLYGFAETKIIKEEYLFTKDTMKIAAEIALFARSINASDVVIDSIGIGKGVADRLRQLGFNVFDFVSSEKAMDTVRYANKKSEAWWGVSRMVNDGKVEYPDDPQLRTQITAVKYDINNTGKLICEPKSKVKEAIGCSPDRADAWIMGISTLHLVSPVGKFKVAGIDKAEIYAMVM